MNGDIKCIQKEPFSGEIYAHLSKYCGLKVQFWSLWIMTVKVVKEG